MILGDGNEQIELAADGVGDGDFIVSIQARVRQFSGAVDAVVVGAEWAHFLGELRELERSRRGEVTLKSSGLDEFRVRIFMTDQAGHVAVEGELYDPGVHEGATLSLQFGPVAFEPSFLPTLLAELASSRTRSNER